MASLRAHQSYGPLIRHLSTARAPAASTSFGKFTVGLLFLLVLIPLASAHPLESYYPLAEGELPKSPNDPSLWVYLGTSAALVLLGGAFAGLTIAYVDSQKRPNFNDEVLTMSLQSDGPR
jgi:hypothetical protein